MNEFDSLEPWQHQRYRILLGSQFFDDVLAGYFQPATDNEYRQHTLGRLLAATLQKGVRQEPTQEECEAVVRQGELRAYEYVPSWGGDVVTRALVRIEDKAPALETSTGIFLHRPDGTGSLSVGYHTANDILRINDEAPIELGLGAPLTDIRAQLASQAETIFDIEM